MNEGFLGIAIAIFVGLIPVMIQLYFGIRAYKKAQIDKYGTFLYEKQYELYLKIFSKAESLNTNSQHMFSLIKDESYTETMKNISEIEFDFNKMYLQALFEFENLIKNNALIIKNSFLRESYAFIKLNGKLRHTAIINQAKGKNLILNPELEPINSLSELQQYSKEHFSKFTSLLHHLKNLIGTEYLTENSTKYVKKRKKEDEDFVYYANNQTNLK